MGAFDFGVIERSLSYLFLVGMTFTLKLTAMAALGGIVFGPLRATFMEVVERQLLFEGE